MDLIPLDGVDGRRAQAGYGPWLTACLCKDFVMSWVGVFRGSCLMSLCLLTMPRSADVSSEMFIRRAVHDLDRCPLPGLESKAALAGISQLDSACPVIFAVGFCPATNFVLLHWCSLLVHHRIPESGQFCYLLEAPIGFLC